jgi:hypothetical protein
VVNPLIDVQKYLPHDVFSENYGQYDDKEPIDIYNKMLHETHAAKQRGRTGAVFSRNRPKQLEEPSIGGLFRVSAGSRGNFQPS